MEKATKELTEKELRKCFDIRPGNPLENPLDLTRYKFTCPFCGKMKSATEAVRLVTPTKITQKLEQKKMSVQVSCSQILVCRDCANEVPASEKANLHK